jgi:hypothetical protein
MYTATFLHSESATATGFKIMLSKGVSAAAVAQ